MNVKRLAVVGICVALVITVVVLVKGTAAGAVTHAPCSNHYAGTPYLDYLNNDGTSTLSGSGGIGGCPSVGLSTTGEGVTITVALQHFNTDTQAWETQAEATRTKGWNRYWRYARSLYMTVTAICIPGDWRVDVTGGDGWAPYEWSSQVMNFKPGDSGVCGSYGGGDG